MRGRNKTDGIILRILRDKALRNSPAKQYQQQLAAQTAQVLYKLVIHFLFLPVAI